VSLIKAINLLIDFETQLRQQEQIESMAYGYRVNIG